MRQGNVKREIVFGIKWIFGLLVLLGAVSAMNGQTVKRVNLGVQAGKAGFVPVAVGVFMDEPVDVMWIRRHHDGYMRVGPKLWKRTER